MAHLKNLRAPFLKTVRHIIIIMSQLIAENTRALDFWFHLDQLKFFDNHSRRKARKISPKIVTSRYFTYFKEVYGTSRFC